jgi:hypothetical protein
MRWTPSALPRPGGVRPLIPLRLLTARRHRPWIARPWIPRPRRLGGLTGPRGRTRTWTWTWTRTRTWCVHIWPLRLVESRRPWPARGRRALLTRARARASRPGAGTCRAWPGTANARHRVFGTLPRSVGQTGIVRRLPARSRRVSGPRRHAALWPGSRRPGRHVRGAGPAAVAARVPLVTGINGVGVGFQVRVPLVSVAVRVGSVAGPAVRASVRPAALTIHPAPPGPSVRHSPPKSSVGRARRRDGSDG